MDEVAKRPVVLGIKTLKQMGSRPAGIFVVRTDTHNIRIWSGPHATDVRAEIDLDRANTLQARILQEFFNRGITFPPADEVWDLMKSPGEFLPEDTRD